MEHAVISIKQHDCPPQSNSDRSYGCTPNAVNSTEVGLAATTLCRLQLDSVVQLGQQTIRSAGPLSAALGSQLQRKGNYIRKVGLIGFRR
jgi:hypothetical protein